MILFPMDQSHVYQVIWPTQPKMNPSCWFAEWCFKLGNIKLHGFWTSLKYYHNWLLKTVLYFILLFRQIWTLQHAIGHVGLMLFVLSRILEIYFEVVLFHQQDIQYHDWLTFRRDMCLSVIPNIYYIFVLSTTAISSISIRLIVCFITQCIR